MCSTMRCLFDRNDLLAEAHTCRPSESIQKTLRQTALITRAPFRGLVSD